MKKLSYLFFFLLVAGTVFQACDDGETYAEMKEKERKAINEFIRENDIKEISLSQFLKDTITNVDENEYVLFPDKGVYMQIVRRGTGSILKDEERADIIARYIEVNIKTGDTVTGNIFDASNPDIFTVTNKNGSYTGAFTSGYMYNSYGSSVPAGWLIPLPYIYIGRKQSEIAKVRLIVPHSQGHSNASSYVYPFYYDITYQRGLQ